LGRARIAADTNDREGVASETDLASNGAKNNSEKASKETDGGAASVLNAVAALEVPNVALAGRRRPTTTTSTSDGSSRSEGGKDEEQEASPAFQSITQPQ